MSITFINTAILIILIILLIITIVLLTRKDEDAEKYYVKTINSFDENAKKALETILKKKTKTSIDYYMLGNINRFLKHNNAKAGEYYKTAIDKLMDELGRYNETYDIIEHKPTHENAELNHVQAIQMVNDIDTFVNNRVENNENNEINNLFREEFRGFNGREIQDAILNSINEQQQNIDYSRTSKKKEVDKYINEHKKMRNDPQNVHDSHVNADLRKTFNKLKNENENRQYIDYEQNIINTISKLDNINKTKKDKAISTLFKMYNNERIEALDTTERDVVQNVWARINHPNNVGNRENLVNSFVESLIDGSGDVCVGGRCGRVIGSLAKLDKDPDVGVTISKDMIRNEIFNHAGAIINDRLAKADPMVKNAYNEINPNEEQKAIIKPFLDNVKEQIKKDTLEENAKIYKMKNDEVKQILEEAYVGLTF